jgi:hypothetical protein
MARRVEPLKSAREYAAGEYITEASTVIYAELRAARPNANEKERTRMIADAIQDAEQLERVLTRRGHRP